MHTARSAAIIVGGGLAGLSAAIYLGRAKRDTLIVDSGRSMARWEPDVQNYLGFPEGVSGEDLLREGRTQARKYHVRFCRDEIEAAERISEGGFSLRGAKANYECRKLLIATGIFHIPPDIPGIRACLGHSLFFCKDCDGYRIQGKPVAIYGWTNEAVEYALGMLFYSSCVAIVLDGRAPMWDGQHKKWLGEYQIPVYLQKVAGVARQGNQIEALEFADKSRLIINVLFTTRGDVYFNRLAKDLGAEINPDGEVVVDLDMRTRVPGLYSAGCVTPANCQMIIAAGQGATAAQAMNRDLFRESLRSHSLRRVRGKQLRQETTRPAIQRKV